MAKLNSKRTVCIELNVAELRAVANCATGRKQAINNWARQVVLEAAAKELRTLANLLYDDDLVKQAIADLKRDRMEGARAMLDDMLGGASD